jgi:hypothetical protein
MFNPSSSCDHAKTIRFALCAKEPAANSGSLGAVHC